MVKVGIILPSTIDVSDGVFSAYCFRIADYFNDPDTHFVFSDQHPILARYINQNQYRKCTVYHLGTKPKHKIGHYTNKGGFTSYIEIDAAIREACEVVIDRSR